MVTISVIGKLRDDAGAMIRRVIESVDPENAVKKQLSLDGSMLTVGPTRHNLEDYNRIVVLAGGKAACPMARATLDVLADYGKSGIVCTKYEHASEVDKLDVLEAAHPVPDEKSVECATRTIEIARNLGEEDLALVLISGGASAIWCGPVEGVTLDDKQVTTSALLRCGADIHEMNCIRKHLSVIKGGRLAETAHPARVISLMLSDVTGDDMTSIASGPTVPDPSTFSNALDIIEKYGIADKLPESVVSHLEAGARNPEMETPKPFAGDFEDDFQLIVGSNDRAKQAADELGQSLGYKTYVVERPLTGEARDAAHFLCNMAKEMREGRQNDGKPLMIIAGGETTVTIRGDGTGGRNQEMALQAAIELSSFPDVCFVSFGTDGNDGPTDAAGAYADSDTVLRARKQNLDPSAYLQNNDSYNFFKKLDDLVITGPTGTNVMDIQLVLISA